MSLSNNTADSERKQYLVMRISGPMMSFGQAGRKGYRPTSNMPPKSVAMGILGCAGGVEREDEESIRELATLDVVVFTLKPGERQLEYHTVGGGHDDPECIPMTSEGELIRSIGKSKAMKQKQIIIRKEFLADADFIIVCSGTTQLIGRYAEALKHPYRPLFLGRREFMPSRPIYDGVYLTEKDAIDRVCAVAKELFPKKLDFNLAFMSDTNDVAEADDFLMDVPIRFSQATGGYHKRPVKYGQMPVR